MRNWAFCIPSLFYLLTPFAFAVDLTEDQIQAIQKTIYQKQGKFLTAEEVQAPSKVFPLDDKIGVYKSVKSVSTVQKGWLWNFSKITGLWFTETNPAPGQPGYIHVGAEGICVFSTGDLLEAIAPSTWWRVNTWGVGPSYPITEGLRNSSILCYDTGYTFYI